MRWVLNKSECIRSLLLCGLLSWTPVLRAAIDIELRPNSQNADVNDVIEIQLFVLSDSEISQSLAAMEIILTWDSGRLELLGHIDPCMKSPCPVDTYPWLQSGFLVDDNLDGLNDDCGDGVFCESISCATGCPAGVICNNSTGFCKTADVPYNDGDAKYVVWSQIGGGDNSAQATPEGLWVTTFQFRAISVGVSELQILEMFGTSSRTQIVGGDATGKLVTGVIGPPVQVVIGGCPSPVVEAVGSRYLSITPAITSGSAALLVSGDLNDSSIDCISLFVQPDGTLGEDAVYQLPEMWGTIFVGDQHIVPESQYEIRADCSVSLPGQMSETVFATTKTWSDVNNDGVIDFSDLLLMAIGAQGEFSGDATLQSLDIFPCIPDRVIDEFDIDAAKKAMNLLPFPCREPCQLHFPLEDWTVFLACMEGPDTATSVPCVFFDLNYDNIVDLQDVSLFMIRP